MASASCSGSVPMTSEMNGGHGYSILSGKKEDYVHKITAKEIVSTFRECMDAKIWSFLPEEVFDKIIARLPVHALFRARVLSKQWKEKIFSVSFQSEVSIVSHKWASFCPLYVGLDTLLGFDRLSSCWRELFSLSHLPRGIRFEEGDDVRNLARCMTGVAGCLIAFKSYGDGSLVIHVTNPINKSWRKLTPLPLQKRRNVHNVQLVACGALNYKVVVITTEVSFVLSGLYPLRLRSPLAIQIYDSISKTWTEEHLAPVLSSDWRYDNSTYFEGTVYCLLANNQHGFLDESAMLNESIILLAYNIETETFKQIEFSLRKITKSYFWWSKLLVCGSDLMLLVAQMDPEIDLNRPSTSNSATSFQDWNKYYEAERLCIREHSLLVYKLDPSSLEMNEVSRGPSQRLLSMSLTDQVASDEHCLYFQTLDELDSGIDSVIVFDVPNNHWTYLSQLSNQKISRVQKKFYSLTNYAFQPGLNPFIEA